MPAPFNIFNQILPFLLIFLTKSDDRVCFAMPWVVPHHHHFPFLLFLETLHLRDLSLRHAIGGSGHTTKVGGDSCAFRFFCFVFVIDVVAAPFNGQEYQAFSFLKGFFML